MQWKAPKYGDTRIIRKFLWWPRTFERLTKWLETSFIVERYSDGQWQEIGFSE
jgi:hypothetical protein